MSMAMPKPCALGAVRSRDRPAVVAPLQRSQVLQEPARQPIQFVRDFLQRRRRAVDFRKLDGFADCCGARRRWAASAARLDLWQSPYILTEQRRVPDPARVEIHGGREALVACGISHREHVFDIGIVEHRLECLGRLAVIDALARAVLPDEVIAVDAVEEIRIGLDQRRESSSTQPPGARRLGLLQGPAR